MSGETIDGELASSGAIDAYPAGMSELAKQGNSHAQRIIAQHATVRGAERITTAIKRSRAPGFLYRKKG